MAKKAKTKKAKVKVKKVRTAEEKAARNLKRKARREARKHAAELKSRIEAKNPINVPVVKASVFPWAEKETSDGLPYSKSVDNPDSLLGQLKREREMNEAAKAKADAKRKELRKPKFAPSAKECIMNVTAE